MKSAVITVFVLLGTAALGVSAHAQGPLYYGAQVGGGTMAALAGGAVGTLIGGISGVLLGLPIEMARSPAVKVYQSFEEIPEPEEPLPMRWGFAGAKVGFGLGVGAGAALGVIWIGKLFGIEGDPQGAWTGAFVGTVAGIMLMTEITAGKYPFSLSHWSCKRTEQEGKISFECSYKNGYLSPADVLLSPMVLAAVGATIGYNATVSLAVSAPVVSMRF